MKTLTLQQVAESPYRQHIIRKEEAQLLKSYFEEQDECQYFLSDFEGKTIEGAGRFHGDYQEEFDFSEEWIQHIICCLFGYKGIY
jgi:hypothetical protein